MRAVQTLGVVGAGTMGSGIALAALYAGLSVVLQDVVPESLESARAYVERFLARKGMEEAGRLLTTTQAIEDLAGVDFVIEAAIEDLPIKQDLFARLDELCPVDVILATNTSTLPVTAIASAARHPGRVGGMHFFNPAPVLPLVEVVRAAQTTPATLGAIQTLAERLGKSPVVTADTPGFIVNRVARPFYGEALRLLGERVATHADIDDVLERGAGFRMGPFRLMDLIGIDINFNAMQSMFTQTFGEPRYRPHWIQQQMVAQNTLGRKTGRGFYRYDVDSASDPDHDEPRPGGGSGVVWLSPGNWGPGVEALLVEGGYQVVRENPPSSNVLVAGVLVAGQEEGASPLAKAMDDRLPPEAPLICQVVDRTLSEYASQVQGWRRLVGFDGLFLASGRIATLTALEQTSANVRDLADQLFRNLGRSPIWVTDSPALIAPRVVAALANEAAFAVLEGVAEEQMIDLAMRSGVNYPQGPIEWARRIGFRRVLAVLDHLQAEYGEPRYRAAPLLRQWARLEGISGT